MVLLQIESDNGTSKIWFGRLAEPHLSRHKSITHGISDETKNNTKKTDQPK
jgi:hypothetical protein